MECLETRTCPGYRADRYLSYTKSDGTSVCTWSITRDDGKAMANPYKHSTLFGFSESQLDAWWPRLCRGEEPHA